MSWDEQRTSFGAIAETYDTYRPDWPAATAAWLTGTEPGGPLADRAATRGLDVLDLGAGTGKLTRTLVEAGHRVTAADLSEGMLAVLSAALPQVRAIQAPAEDLPLAAAAVDAITIAQAWHWLRQPDAALECARVLRPGGLLAIAWHRRLAGEGWLLELDQLTRRQERSASATASPAADRSVRSHGADIALPPVYAELQTADFDYELRLTPEGLAGLASSWSYVHTSPDRERLLDDVEALGRRAADSDGLLTIPHRTYCFRAELSAA